MSIGHRLTILKGVYDVKIKQGIPIDSDHWIPPCMFSEDHMHLWLFADYCQLLRLANKTSEQLETTYPAS